MATVVRLDNARAFVDEKSEFDRARADMARAFARWIRTTPDADDVVIEIEGTTAQMVGIAHICGQS